MTATRIPPLEELLTQDLDYICGNLKDEFGRMAGQKFLITGGAGFLGYYLVQAALHFNRTAAGNEPFHVTVWDNFIRGTPARLTGPNGAPGKGNRLLNYCDIRTGLQDFTVDANSHKQGKFNPGARIPILEPEKIREVRPDYMPICRETQRTRSTRSPLSFANMATSSWRRSLRWE